MYNLSAVKTRLQRYCDISYSWGDGYQIWILKHSKELLEYIQSIYFSSCHIIWRLYPMHNYFSHRTKNIFEELVQRVTLNLMFNLDTNALCYDGTHFILYKTTLIQPNSYLKLIMMCSSCWLTTHLLCLVVVFVNRQSPFIWVPIVLLFSLTCSLIRIRQTVHRSFSTKTTVNFTLRNIDETISLNNVMFGNYVDHIDPIELEINDTTDTGRSTSYFYCHLGIDIKGRPRTKLSDKRDDCSFSEQAL